jgi:hypothetical protein
MLADEVGVAVAKEPENVLTPRCGALAYQLGRPQYGTILAFTEYTNKVRDEVLAVCESVPHSGIVACILGYSLAKYDQMKAAAISHWIHPRL